MATNLTCNLCGKKFDSVDDEFGIGITINLGPRSRFDGCIFDADFCCSCIDRIVSTIAVNCAIQPMSESITLSTNNENIFPEEA